MRWATRQEQQDNTRRRPRRLDVRKMLERGASLGQIAKTLLRFRGLVLTTRDNSTTSSAVENRLG